MVVIQASSKRTSVLIAVVASVACLILGFIAGRLTAPRGVSPSLLPQIASVAPTIAARETAQPSGLAALNERLQGMSQTLPTATSGTEKSEVTPQTPAPQLSPAPPSTFPPQRVSGSGQAASEREHLYSGLYIFHLTHQAEGHFSVWLLDRTGERIELLANTSEPFEGSKAVHIPFEGDYVFDLSAEGPWQISLGSPEIAAGQTSFEAPMQAATRAFQLDGGLRIFRLSHSGTGHFSAWLLDRVGNKVELLANTSGSAFSGSKAVRVQSGWYVLDVSADRPWSIRVE